MDIPNKHLPRDVFLYLLMVVALGMTAVNFGTLLFQYVNVYVPDIVSDRYASSEMYYGTIRWAIAALIVVFPVFVWVMRFLNKDIQVSPEKRDLKIRKWLLYLTLFVAGMVVIGDLVALIFNFLQGELTSRFILKALVIFFIAGSVFWYYLNELREQGSRSTRAFSRSVMVLVAVSVIAGFFVAGLPQNQRLKRLDDQRVGDLQTLQWQIVEYWQSKRALPGTLNDLRSSITGFVPPVDPQTQQPYEYRALGGLAFNLCATFQTAGQEDPRIARPIGREPLSEASNWVHDIGRVCFERTIDPDFYPAKPSPRPL